MIKIWYHKSMDEILADKLDLLKSEIENHPDVIKLNELDKLLNENEEVMKLAYKKDIAITKYEDAMRYFGENSDEALTAQKELHQAKLELDKNELVMMYNNQFKKVRKLYDKINEEIFNPFN